MKMNLVRSRKLRSGVAAFGALALLVVVPSLDHQANAQSLPLPADSAKVSTDKLDVVVGQTVALTTDQKGAASPFSLYIVNGQIAGNGSGTLEVPTGPNTTTPRPLTSTTGEVGNFLSVPGTFGGDMPLEAVTTLKVNGQTVDPDQGYNLNGDVEVTYTVTNKTSRQQAVTYKDLYGVEQTKVTDIPVPFGDSYSVVFGDGWDITDPGDMTATTTGAGTSLAATLILFPIVQGTLGGTTQSVTVKAKAENASLPNTTHTIVPVKLADYYDGVGLQLGPALDNKLLTPLDNTLAGSIGQVVLAANIISGYAGGFSTLSTDFINPIVDDINAIKADPAALNRTLAQLSNGLIELGQVMDTNAAAKDDIASLLTALGKTVNKDLTETVEWLGTLINDAGPESAKAASALRSLSKIITDANVDNTLEDANNRTKLICDTVGPTVDYYGPVSSFIAGNPGTGSSALAAGIKTTSGSDKTNLTALQTALNNQANASLIVNSTTAWGQIGSLPIPDYAKTLLKGAACTPVTTAVEGIVLAESLTPTLDAAAKDLDLFAAVAASPEAKKVYEDVLGGLNDLSGLLSNAKCTDKDILAPIASAIKQYGPSGLEDHAVEIAKQIFSKCGLAQIMTFFGQFDRAVGLLLTDLGDIVGKAEKDVPKITNGIKKVQSLATLAGKAFAAIPVVGGKVGTAVTDAAIGVEGKGDAALAEVSSYAGFLQASLVAMNDRGVNGDGAPYGDAYLTDKSDGNVKSYTAYQITVQGAAPYTQWWLTATIAAVIFLVLAAGLGTFLYRRRINP